MVNTIPGPLDEDKRLRDIAPAIAAIVPIEERGRHELMRIAAGLANGLPDRYAQDILRAAEALAVQPANVEYRQLYALDSGTMAHIGNSSYVLGRLAYLAHLHLEPRKAERDAADELERQGNLVYAVVAEPHTHCLGLIAVNPLAKDSGAETRDNSVDGD